MVLNGNWRNAKRYTSVIEFGKVKERGAGLPAGDRYSLVLCKTLVRLKRPDLSKFARSEGRTSERVLAF